VLRDLRSLLWPVTSPLDGASVRHQVHALLHERITRAPQRGKGARRLRFLQHVLAVTQRYDAGLYHCYNDPRIPPTSNDLEGQHGVFKHHLRKLAGRASTSGGPTETVAELLVGPIDAVHRHGTQTIRDAALDVKPAAYAAARAKLARLREPARRYRSVQRAPQKHLDGALSSWLNE
jgi:hypothetical protein